MAESDSAPISWEILSILVPDVAYRGQGGGVTQVKVIGLSRVSCLHWLGVVARNGCKRTRILSGMNQFKVFIILAPSLASSLVCKDRQKS